MATLSNTAITGIDSITDTNSDTRFNITEGTNTATTSGTAIDFTSLPSGVKRILVIFEQVSTNGTSSLLIQIGDSGGFETTGYESVGDTDTTRTRELTGFQLTGDGGTAANAEMTGIITLARADSATFLWVASGSLHRTDAIATNHQRSNGFKSLSSELTQLRLTTVGGSQVFDNGTANIQYEF